VTLVCSTRSMVPDILEVERMASIEKRTRDGKVTWQARWRDPAGRQRKKRFGRKTDAERHLVGVEHSQLVGSYIDPASARVTVAQWSTRWLASQTQLKPSTKARYEGIVARHITPTWGDVPLSGVSHADVAAWVTRLSSSGLAGSTVRYIHRVFALILAMAVQDGRLAKNPASAVRLPKAARSEKRYLSHGQVAALAEAAGDQRLVVLMLAYTGLRWSELAGLRVRRVDLMRRRLDIAEAVVEVRGHVTWGTPKNHQGRSVPIPRSLVDDLAVHLAGKGPGELVFTTRRGAVLRNLNWRRDVFDVAARSAGLDGLTPHELRHTAPAWR
jgi:integrase